MEHFKEIIGTIFSKIIISPADSDEDRAKKIILYTFIGAIIGIIIISWILFVLFTFNNDKIKVPMINNDNIYVALGKLSERNLVADVIPRFTEKHPKDIVYKQKPKQGNTVKKGRVITFYVSLGPHKKALPNFRGLSLFELQNFLQQEYAQDMPFKIQSIKFEFSSTVEKGKIIDQTPNDGTPLYNVAKLALTVSNGPKVATARTIPNFSGKSLEEASKILSDLELYYTYEFAYTKNRRYDMQVIEQSIPEGALVDDIMEESKTIVLKVNKYRYIKNEKIVGSYVLDLPKKPIAYLVEVKIKKDTSKDKTILSRMTKGGVSIPVPYTAKMGNKLIIYFDGKYSSEVQISKDIK